MDSFFLWISRVRVRLLETSGSLVCIIISLPLYHDRVTFNEFSTQHLAEQIPLTADCVSMLVFGVVSVWASVMCGTETGSKKESAAVELYLNIHMIRLHV